MERSEGGAGNSTQDIRSNDMESNISLSSPTVVVSKRQKKRLATYVKRKEVRRQIRKAYKDRRKLRRQCLQKTVIDAVQCPEKLDSSSSFLSRKALQRVPSMSESPCSTKVVLDCAYDHLMSFKDLCKLANQICNCYALNRRFQRPVQLFVTGLGRHTTTVDPNNRTTTYSSTRLIDRLRIAGCEKWDINLCNEDYTELFEAKSIVYLCAESSNGLPECFSPHSTEYPTQFSAEDVYVIGGLVDHNHLVGHCYKQAMERGHRTARLPIIESGMVLSGRHVLSTVQVFHALAPVLAGCMTWTESLNAAVPPRKTVQAAASIL